MDKKKKDIPINTRYPYEVYESMKDLAEKHERSFNGEIIWALREYIKRNEGSKDATGRTDDHQEE
jgi:hypothetical protein